LIGTNIFFLDKGIDVPIFFPSVFIHYRPFRTTVVATQTGNTLIAKMIRPFSSLMLPTGHSRIHFRQLPHSSVTLKCVASICHFSRFARCFGVHLSFLGLGMIISLSSRDGSN